MLLLFCQTNDIDFNGRLPPPLHLFISVHVYVHSKSSFVLDRTRCPIITTYLGLSVIGREISILIIDARRVSYNPST